MTRDLERKVKILIDKGVRILDPSAVDIGEDVDPDRISGDRVTIYPGCRIYGDRTLIMEKVTLGFEGPVTVENCLIGPGVNIKAGFCRGSVFLDNSAAGAGAHIRAGCLLEECSSLAHTVGIKQTILFPFVTLGSLINFCDCLMSGGTGRKDHSEVGSSFIHFNFTPNGDKATASLLGDVPRGVTLNQRPIFMGGQGGLVGPARIGFGTVTAAGTILRRDCPEGNKLHLGGGMKRRTIPYHAGIYMGVRDRFFNNFNYIANLIALKNWYLRIRLHFFASSDLKKLLYRGAVDVIDRAVAERIRRVQELAEKMPASSENYQKVLGKKLSPLLQRRKEEIWEKRRALGEYFKAMKEETEIAEREYSRFIEKFRGAPPEPGANYPNFIRKLDPETAARATAWLRAIVDEVNGGALAIVPSFKT